MKRIVAALLLAGVLVSACGGDGADEGAEAPPTSQPSDGLPPAGGDDATFPSAMGPGISVSEALESTQDEMLLVNGFVFVYADGTVVLAELIAESYPPQPAGASITVEGVDLMQLPLTEGPTDTEVEITAWTDIQVQLLGEIVDGVFVGTSVASA